MLSILFSAARAKIMPLWIKLRMWTSPTFLKSRVLVKIRQFFVQLLDVRPRHKRDYYPFFRWLVSKRLAFALVVALGLVSAIYVVMMLPEKGAGDGTKSVPTYQYRSIPLKFYSGNAHILAREGYVAYSGGVDAGAASGRGTLYASDGSMVYEGIFADNMYNGSGTLYYRGGTPRYRGEFTDNVFNGTGIYYWPNGAMAYQGGYLSGLRSGQGTLYNSVGNRVFQGNFLHDEIVYHDFLDRPTDEITELYTGEMAVYQSEEEYCVAMPEIDALYAVSDGSDTLENEWTVDRVYVMKNSVQLEDGIYSSLRQLQAVLGEPLYFGTSWVNLPEAVAWNLLAEEFPDMVEPIEIDQQPDFQDVFVVDGYDRNREMYLYTFERSGILYSFYFAEGSDGEFVMYAVEKA